jgi:LPXTG-site transpeptidase (sortase) family protein
MTGRWRHRRWQWWLSNVLILGGLLVLAYPVGTWAYTRWEQRALRGQLAQTSPAVMAAPAASLPFSSLVDLTTATQALRQAEADAIKAKRDAELQQLDQAATAFETEVAGKGGKPLGRIVIPAIKVDVVVIEGVGTSDLRAGPGHWPETPMPGQGGNFVVSGHRTTYGAPFFKLNQLKAGDEIDLLLPYVSARYAVTSVVIVLPNQTSVVAQRGIEELSFATCNPIYSAAQRLVVKAKLVGFKLSAAPGAAAATGSAG